METKPLVLCDTNVLIEFYKGNQVILDQLQLISQTCIAASVVTAGELIYGAFNRQELIQIQKDLKHLKVLQLSEKISEVFIQIIAKYSLSHNLTVPDALIAATAISNNIELYTLNKKDFRFIEGLKMYIEQ